MFAIAIAGSLLVRKHPAPEGALRLIVTDAPVPIGFRQKAPSTRRCIKAGVQTLSRPMNRVRKHPAPEGALRLHTLQPVLHTAGGQKAPSTKRPIDGTYSPPSSPLRAERPDGSAEEALLMSHGPDSSTTTPGCARSHRQERRPFGLTSSEAGG